MSFCPEDDHYDENQDLRSMIHSSDGDESSRLMDSQVTNGNAGESFEEQSDGTIVDTNLDRNLDSDSKSQEPVADNSGVIFDFPSEQHVEKENHLGKGLIKPTNVQVGMDGYHFSYEKPIPHFAKAETFTQEAAAEKRVINPEFEPAPKIKEDLNPVFSNTESEAVQENRPEEIATEENVEEWVDNQPVDDEVQVIEDETTEAVLEPTELAEVPLLNEMEEGETEAVPILADSPEFVTVPAEESKITEITYLAGRQTWFGVPLPSMYRITNFGVVITDQSNRNHQFTWEQINQARLKQSFLAKLLGLGNVELVLKNTADPNPVIEGVIKPKEIMKRIEELLNNVV